MIVPNRNYTVDVEFDRTRNRWAARFRSEKPEGISFAFPLPDAGTYQNHGHLVGGYTPVRVLDRDEEKLLALTFQQMVTTALEQMASQRLQLDAPVSASEAELVN